MNISRLEAFSDGVLAIIITITVLGIRIPSDASFAGLVGVLPTFLIYAWSFQTVGTYWNNHHYLLKATQSVNSSIMWANLNLLFWLSLIPFTTEWLGEHVGATWPTFAYSAVLLAAAVAYTILEHAIAAPHRKNSPLAQALAKDTKGKASLASFAIALFLSFFNPWIAYFFIVMVSLIWLIPDRRLLGSAEE